LPARDELLGLLPARDGLLAPAPSTAAAELAATDALPARQRLSRLCAAQASYGQPSVRAPEPSAELPLLLQCSRTQIAKMLKKKTQIAKNQRRKRHGRFFTVKSLIAPIYELVRIKTNYLGGKNQLTS